MWSLGLIGAGAILTALFFAWPVVGETRLPLAAFTLYVRLLAALLLSGALVVWDVRRRHALAKIAEVHGIRVAEVPSSATGIVGVVLLASIVASFVLEQRLAYDALIRNNTGDREEGVLEFLERFPQTHLMDSALEVLLKAPDFLEHTQKAYAKIAPPLRGRAAKLVLDRVVAQPPNLAGRDLAEFVRTFEGADNAAAARRYYVEDVIPRFLARGEATLPPGVRAMLGALADLRLGARVGLVVEPATPPAAIETLAGRLTRMLEGRAPYQILRKGGEYIPRRVEVKWAVAGTKTTARIRLFSSSSPAPLHEASYELDEAPGGDPHALDRFLDAIVTDILPPP